MKKVFVDPKMRISYFDIENVVTLSVGDYSGTEYTGSKNECTESHSILFLDWVNDLSVTP